MIRHRTDPIVLAEDCVIDGGIGAPCRTTMCWLLDAPAPVRVSVSIIRRYLK